MRRSRLARSVRAHSPGARGGQRYGQRPRPPARLRRPHAGHGASRCRGRQFHDDSQLTATALRAFAVTIDPAAGEIRLAGPTGAQQWNLAGLLPASSPIELPGTAAAGAAIAPASAGDVCQRFSFEMRPAPLAADVPAQPAWGGAAIVLGSGPTADALIAAMQAAGVTVYAISPDADLDTALRKLEEICAAGPAPHLFITDGPRCGADRLRPCRRLDARPAAGDDSAVLRLPEVDAAGRPGQVAEPCHAGRHGLAKTATSALPGARRSPRAARWPVCSRASSSNSRSCRTSEICGSRWSTPPPIPRPTRWPPTSCANWPRPAWTTKWLSSAASGSCRKPSNVSRPTSDEAGIEPGSTWIVTGGARGITAACALELGRRWGLKLHLIGSTPLEPLDPAWRIWMTQGSSSSKRRS